MTVALLNIVTIKTVYRKTLASGNFAMIKTKRNAFYSVMIKLIKSYPVSYC